MIYWFSSGQKKNRSAKLLKNESNISLFDFLDCRFQIERARRVVGVGVVLLIGHFQNGTVETVDKVVHFAGLIARSVGFVEPA
jgi:hypothetical protein